MATQFLSMATVLMILLIDQPNGSCQNRSTKYEKAEKSGKDILSFCAVKYKISNVYVNCSFRHLTFIPALPIYSTSVNLSHNQIAMIFNPAPFSGLSELRELDLSYNPLQFIPPNIFIGLNKLDKLHIRNSLLYKQGGLILDTLITGLNQLSDFSFTFQLPESTKLSPIPCMFNHQSQPFGKVDNLQYIEILEIDSALIRWPTNHSTVHVVFNTKSLHVINGIYCYYGQMNSSLFDYMPFLEKLCITNPFVTGEVTGDFISFNKNLKELSVYGPNAPYGNAADFIFNVTEAISNLYSMTVLTLQGISDGIRMKFHCSSLGVHSITKLYSLTKLSLAENSLTFNYPEECKGFPRSLKHIDLQQNCISNIEINFCILFFNKQVVTINARDQSNCAFMASSREETHIAWNKSGSSVAFNGQKVKDIREYSLETFVLTNSSNALDFGSTYDKYPRLKYLDLSLNNKVARLSIPYFFSACRPNLRYLNLSDCRITEIDEYGVSNFSKLQILDLSANLLGRMRCSLADRLFNLKALQELNLANNQISCVPSYMFGATINLQKLDLSGNEIHGFDASLAQAKHLEYLYLSGNRLERLSDNIMKDLDALAVSKSVYVDLSGNILLCTCDTLNFLQWMRDTTVIFLNREAYVCTLKNGKETSIKDLRHIVADLESQCSSKTVLIIAISAVSTCCLAMLCGALLYRFRWRIRYWYYKTKIKIPYKSSGLGYEQIFEYDLFVSYSSEDNDVARQGTIQELETERGLHACIHERDFKPGESIAFNISKGIHNSKRTVLFISKAFLASEWCLYELNIARMEALHTGRKVILVIMLETIPSKSLPIDVLDIINTYTYLEYPRSGTEADLEVFWSKCADFISED